MMMKSNSIEQKIYDYIQQKGEFVTVKELNDHLGYSYRYIHKGVSKLLQNGFVIKTGVQPNVFYELNAETQVETENPPLPFVSFGPDGSYTSGVTAFEQWCTKRGFSDVEMKYAEYLATKDKYEATKTNGLYDATSKIYSSFGDKLTVNRLYYGEIYSYEIFGKTTLAKLILQAKSSPENWILDLVWTELEAALESYLETNDELDTIYFVPPSVSRKLQLMDWLKSKFKTKYPQYKIGNIKKIKRDTLVAQKTLKSKDERQYNAKSTFYVEPGSSQNVLIIDDAVGSGSSIYEIAKKIKKSSPEARIDGLALVGSQKGFEVINQI